MKWGCEELSELAVKGAAAVVVHLPGLIVKWEYEEFGEFVVEGVAAAAVEGAFLLLLATRAFRAARGLCGYLEERYARPSKETEKHNTAPWQSLLPRLCAVLYGGLAVSAASFSFSAIVGDAAFRAMSGNDSPSAEVLRAGYENPWAQVLGRLQSDLLGTLWTLVFGWACLGGGVFLYTYPWRRKGRAEPPTFAQDAQMMEALRDQGDVGPTEPPPQVPLASPESPSPPGARDAAGALLAGAWPRSQAAKTSVAGIVLGVATLAMNERGWYTPVAFAYLSLLFKAADDPSHIQLSRVAPKGAAGAPPAPPTRGMNLIYLHHESMSGAIALGPEEGRAAMPWFQEKMHNDPDFYVVSCPREASDGAARLSRVASAHDASCIMPTHSSSTSAPARASPSTRCRRSRPAASRTPTRASRGPTPRAGASATTSATRATPPPPSPAGASTTPCGRGSGKCCTTSSRGAWTGQSTPSRWAGRTPTPRGTRTGRCSRSSRSGWGQSRMARRLSTRRYVRNGTKCVAIVQPQLRDLASLAHGLPWCSFTILIR